jgi:hypothetical protein
MINRRNVLKATAIGGSGLAALAYSPKPTLAASGWNANSPSEVSDDNGELSSLEIPESGFSFSLEYNGLGSGSHSIDFELEAKLSSASSFESVFSESFDVEGDSGTVDESKLSTSFPVDLLASTSMDTSDFEEPQSDTTETTTVDLRVSFSWSGEKDSVTDSDTASFNVNVKNTGGPSYTVVDDFEDNDLSEYTGNTGGATSVGTEHVKNGSYSLKISDPGNPKKIVSTSGLNAYPEQGDTWRYWTYAGSDSNHLRMIFGYQDSDNYYFVNATVGPSSESLYVTKRETGNETVLVQTGLDDDKVDQNQAYEFEVSWGTDGSITATMYDSNGDSLSTVSTTDNTFTSGGIGWGSNSSMGSNTFFDFCRIL